MQLEVQAEPWTGGADNSSGEIMSSQRPKHFKVGRGFFGMILVVFFSSKADDPLR